ncbi:MAG: prepilin-type N-terminal cleavage/methylation domain-containing protein, partial [Oscillospiraceae bacterium]|nr:prepilin-type N-terminal cleavage/methylation domain-containing protein [Oscillospiraceae bacterium]
MTVKRLRNSKRKGFTLIELIVVIVIIAILVAA